jgi:hypothetical protein
LDVRRRVNAVRDGRLIQPQEEDSAMASKAAKATKPRKPRKPWRPVSIIGAGVDRNGQPRIDRSKLKKFIEALERKGISASRIRFCARNAPFMRRPPVSPG